MSEEFKQGWFVNGGPERLRSRAGRIRNRAQQMGGRVSDVGDRIDAQRQAAAQAREQRRAQAPVRNAVRKAKVKAATKKVLQSKYVGLMDTDDVRAEVRARKAAEGPLVNWEPLEQVAVKGAAAAGRASRAGGAKARAAGRRLDSMAEQFVEKQGRRPSK